MAKSFSLVTDAFTYTYNGTPNVTCDRHMKLDCVQTIDYASFSSKINWTLTVYGDSQNWYYDTGPTTVTINGVQVYYKARTAVDNVHLSNNVFPVKSGSVSGSLTVAHDSDGTKSINVSMSTAIFYSAVKTKSGTWSLDNIELTKPGTPSISIQDLGINKFKLNVTKGANGTNNPANSYEAQYTTNSTWTGCSNGDEKSISSDCTAKLKARTLGTHSNSDWVETSAAIKYYGNPSNPGKPTLSSKKEGKPTLKEDLTFRWTAASAGSSHAPIRGYRIRLKVNGSFYDLDPNSDNDYIDTGNTNTYWTIPQSIKDTLKVKDTIQLSIYAYSTNGVGTPIFNGGGTTGAQVLSDIYTISSNGVVRVNVPGLGYKSGVVYVKDTSGNWKEAQGVFANSSGSWKESQ